MRREYIPRPGAFGTHPMILSRRLDGSLTANNTTTLNLGGVHRKAFVERLAVSARTVPVDNDGTLIVTVKKRDASAGANVTLTTGVLNLESLTASATTKIPLVATLTDAQLTLDEGDTLFVEIVSNSAAIDTQPVDLVFTAVIGLLQ